MKKIKYVSNYNGIFIPDNYKKRVSDSTTYSCLVALDSNMRVVKPYVRHNSIFRSANTSVESKDFKGKSNLFYNIGELTYLVDCGVVKKGANFNPKPLTVNILQIVGEDLVLQDVTTKLPYELRDLLLNSCLGYLKLRMS